MVFISATFSCSMSSSICLLLFSASFSAAEPGWMLAPRPILLIRHHNATLNTTTWSRDNDNKMHSEIVYIMTFIHSGYFCCASSSPLLFRGAPDYSSDTMSELTCTPKRYRQL